MSFNSDSSSADSSDCEPESALSIQEGALAKIREFRTEDVIGHNFVILHLKSEVGKSLNHHKCKVLDFDHENTWEGRYHCQILTGESKDKMYKLKLENLGEYASKALTVLPQPTSVDLMEPRDFIIHMIMAYSSYRYSYPFPKLATHESDFISPDAEGRALLIARYVIHHLGLNDFIINGFESEGDFSIHEMSKKAKLSELVDNLQKWDPEFCDQFRALDCSTYYVQMKGLRVGSQNDPAALKRWQEKDFCGANTIKNKKRLCKALEITIQYMICFLHIRPEQKGRMELALHHKTVEIMKKVDVTKSLECGKVVGNNIPSLFQDPYPADKDAHTNFYLKHHLATQQACYGDKIVDFRRFSFGLSGGSNLPNCFLCSKILGKNDLRVAKLDCHHIFHRECVTELWAREECKKCPICKEKHYFAESYELSDQLHNRFFKFIIYGRCERCSSFLEERKDHTILSNILGG